MNRYVRAASAAIVMASGLASVGCVTQTGATCDGTKPNCGDHYRNWVDVSWPYRYDYAARQATLAPFAQQAMNGHLQLQTVWNWYFEPGSDKLNGAGIEKLDSLARTTPAPDPKLYIQAARDLPLSADNANNLAAIRDDLTARRAAAIQKYMATQPGNTVAYEIAVVDSPVPGISSTFANNAFRGQARGYAGAITGAGGFQTANVNSGTTLIQGSVGGAGAPMGAGVGSAPAGPAGSP